MSSSTHCLWAYLRLDKGVDKGKGATVTTEVLG